MPATVSEVFDGRYRIDEILGKGGFATVYGALDLETGRETAVKVLAPDQPGGSYDHVTAARFRREAEMLARLRSPHTVRTFGSGTNQPFTSCLLEGGHPWPGAPARPPWHAECDCPPPKFPMAEQIWTFFQALAPLSDRAPGE